MLLHPVAVAAVLVLLLNDHVLKSAFPGLLTGKLSDVVGLVFFPLLVAAVGSRLLRRHPPGLVPASALSTAIAFALVKLTVPGSAAFAWLLGSAQWLIVIALTGHATLQPVAVVRDPTDLLALPAVLVAVRIARRSKPTGARPLPLRSRLAPLAMAVLMAASTMATEQAPYPSEYPSATTTVTLTPDHPAVTRHISWSTGAVDKVEVPPGRVWLGASKGSGEARAALVPDDGVVVFLLADDPDIATPDTDSIDPVDKDGNVRYPTTTDLVLHGPCSPTCVGGATAVVRWATGTPPADGLTVQLDASLALPVTDDAAASSATSTISFDPGGFDGAPTVVSATKRGSLVVSSRRTDAHADMTVQIAADALPRPLDYPLLGYAVVSFTRTGTGLPDDAAIWDVTIGTHEVSSVNETGPMSTASNILLTCQPRAACRILVTIAASYDKYLMGPQAAPPADAIVTMGYTIVVRLEAYDGRTIPADAITITAK